MENAGEQRPPHQQQVDMDDQQHKTQRPSKSKFLHNRLKALAKGLQAASERLSDRSKKAWLVLAVLLATTAWLVVAFSAARQLLPPSTQIKIPRLPKSAQGSGIQDSVKQSIIRNHKNQ